MRKAWRTLARPFEFVIERLACRISGHPIIWPSDYTTGSLTLQCLRCGRSYRFPQR